jgi:hypothetical protein
MESMYLDFEFIQNCEIVANVCAELRSLGFVVVCTGGDDIEAVVIAFLVSEAKKEAWPLCGSCARQVSQLGVLM